MLRILLTHLFVTDPTLTPVICIFSSFCFLSLSRDVITLLSLVSSFDGRLPTLATFHPILLFMFELFDGFDLT